MKRSYLALIIALVLLLTACGGQPEKAPAKSSSPSVIDASKPSVIDPAPFFDGTVKAEHIDEAAKRLTDNPREFGAFASTEKQGAYRGFCKSRIMRNGYILPIGKYDLNTSPADGNRALIFYKQYSNDDATGRKGRNIP